MAHTIQEIATALSMKAVGDSSIKVQGLAEPADATSDHLAMAMKPEYAKDLGQGAAKAAVLANPDAAKQARRLLEQLPDRVLDGAAQQIMVELGQNLVVDGAFGNGSERAYRAVLAETPEMGVASAPLPRLLTLARAHWVRTSFRVDLF